MNLGKSMWSFFASLFIWWRGHTIGTYIFTAKNGIYVGSDNFGNKYFKSKKDERRWVIYSRENDASCVSPNWHGWLHRTIDKIPSSSAITGEKMHELHKNMTGTADAYHPNKFGKPINREYTSWEPES